MEYGNGSEIDLAELRVLYQPLTDSTQSASQALKAAVKKGDTSIIYNTHYLLEDFGAVVDDGTTNNSPVMQAAFNEILNNNNGIGTVVIPKKKGKIRFSDQMTFNKVGGSLQIVSDVSTRLRFRDGGKFWLGNLSQVILNGLTLVSSDDQTATAADVDNAMVLGYCRAEILNCRIMGMIGSASIIYANHSDLNFTNVEIGGSRAPNLIENTNWQGFSGRNLRIIDLGYINEMEYNKFGLGNPNRFIYFHDPLPTQVYGQRQIYMQDCQYDEGAIQATFEVDNAAFLKMSGCNYNTMRQTDGKGIKLNNVKNIIIEYCARAGYVNNVPSFWLTNCKQVKINGFR